MPGAGVAGRLTYDPQTAFAAVRRRRAFDQWRSPMTWIKPEFEFLVLCSEVTSYLHRR
ncbi:MAG TPA: hypothetical protein VG365_14810 [Solirubrobacteraceae bacterium]|jgi:hypothetical protein|nr:hypothetical protein [Solirubrobacteraceae bacterium]